MQHAMHNVRAYGWLASVALAAAVPVASAQEIEALVIPLGSGATLSEDDGEALSEPQDRFTIRTNEFTGTNTLRTSETEAVVLYQGVGIMARVAVNSTVTRPALPVVDNERAVSIGLADGEVVIQASQDDMTWVVASAGKDRRDGFVVMRKGIVGISAGDNSVFASLSGTAYYFAGNVPAFGVQWDEQSFRQTADVVIGPGSQFRVGIDELAVQGVPESLRELSRDPGNSLYALGLRAGEAWVERAEQGDFTPVRLSAGAPPSVLPSSGLGPQYAFDQARAAVVSAAPQAARTPVRTQGASPVRTLLATGRPTEVIIGQRLARTRIVRGRVGGIGVNPSVDPLFTLAGLMRGGR